MDFQLELNNPLKYAFFMKLGKFLAFDLWHYDDETNISRS